MTGDRSLRTDGDGSVVRTGLPRAVEVPLAAVALVAALPVIALSAAAIALTSRGPILFRQKRIGRGGKPFEMIKLRTMRISPGGPRVTARGDTRVTAVGRFLRRLKIDEIPGLWNVLRGDMALVGPRPEVPDLVDSGDALWREVLQARPGLTDPTTLDLRDEEEILARVEGDRDRFYREVLRPRKLEGYVSYLRRRTPWSDVRVLFETARALLRPSRRAPLPADLSEGPAGLERRPGIR